MVCVRSTDWSVYLCVVHGVSVFMCDDPLISLDIIESFWSALQNCAMPRRWCEAWTALIPEASVQWESSQQNIKNIQKAFSLRSILFLQSYLSHSCQLQSSVTVGWTHPAPRRRATSCCGTSSNSSHPQTWKRAPSRDFSFFFIVSSFRVSESECFTSTSECGSHRLPQIAKTRLEKIWELRCSCVILHPCLSTLGSDIP